MDTLRLLFLGTAIGASVANAFGVWRAPRMSVRWSGAIFFIAVAFYATKVSALGQPQFKLEGILLLLDIPVTALSVATVGWFWLFVQTLFDDLRVRLWHPAVIVVLALLGAAAVYTPHEISRWIWLASNIMQAALLVHALAIVLRGWKSDLVETRRRLRGPFMAVVTVYTLLMRGLETWSTFNGDPEWFLVFNAMTLALMCLAATLVFLEPRTELFGPVEHTAAKPAAAVTIAADRATQADLDRLDRLMKTDEVWREEGLTIASLAMRMDMPEAQLRKLINDRLGHRNFPSFVNGHRIAAAKRRLADPNEARTSISAIAFDIGFASLGPFNRAFREETGASPSEWRRKALDLPAETPPAAIADAR
jgi:AraC-like DNA-binding protein